MRLVQRSQFLACLLLLATLGISQAQEQPATNATVELRAITQRPCLLIDPADVPGIKQRFEALPDHPQANSRKIDAALNALLFGDEPIRRKVTADFVASARRVFTEPPRDHLWLIRRTAEHVYAFDVIASFGYLTDAEQREFRALVVAKAKLFVGDDPAHFPSPDSPNPWGVEFKTGFSTCNRWTDQFVAAALVGLCFPDEPLAKHWVRYAVEQTKYQLANGNWDGAWNEVPRYHGTVLGIYSSFLPALKRRAGVDLLQDPNLKQLLDWYVRFSSTRVRFPETSRLVAEGEPTLPVWGDSNYGNYFGVLAMYAPHYATTDPAFSRRLMWMWRRAGSPFHYGWQHGLCFPMLTDASLPDEPQTLASAFCRKMGYVALRSNFDTPKETVVYMRGGTKGITHGRADLGSIDLFSHGIPLALGSQSGPYDDRIEWNRSQQSNNVVVFGGTSRDRRECSGTLLGFQSTDAADYTVVDCSRPAGRQIKPEESFHWRRHLLLVKQPDYLIVWDEIDSPQSSEWFLHTAYGADLDIHVLSPAAPLVPNEKVGRFGDAFEDPKQPGTFPKKACPYPFSELKYFAIPAAPGEHFVTVLHPRASDATPMRATLRSADKRSVTLAVEVQGKRDVIALDIEGCTFQRDALPAVRLPMRVDGNMESVARPFSDPR